MEMHKRQRQASLILPFVQQLSRIEEESKFAFLKFEKSHASFKMWVVVHGKKKKRNEEEKENFLFVVLVMKQVDPSTTHYGYNACNINIDISFFLSFIRLDIYVYAPIIIHYRRRKKIIDSKQLCTMCVHIEI